MPRIVPHDPERANGETAEIFREIRSAFGMVPNPFRTSARNPPSLRAKGSTPGRVRRGLSASPAAIPRPKRWTAAAPAVGIDLPFKALAGALDATTERSLE